MVEGTEAVENRISVGNRVTVDGMKYAVGLLWAPLQDPDDPLPEIREAMESEPGVDLYCQRPSSSPQYGLGRTSSGHHAGDPSLAASVASALSDKTSVCGVFRVDEGWWFVAIRNDVILTEEDILFATEDEAKRAFFAMMAVPDWALRVVPEEWNVDGAVQLSLPDLIKSVRKVRLYELSVGRRTRILIFLALFIVALVAAVLWAGYTLFQGAFVQQKIIVLPTPEVVKPVEPEPEKPKPWEKLPDTEVFLNKCWNNAYQLSSIVIPGWKMGKVSCSIQGITTSWSKSWSHGGRISWLKTALNEYKLNKVSVSPSQDGTSASGHIQFNDIPMISSIPMLTVNQLREQLTDIRQATNLSFNFDEGSITDNFNTTDANGAVSVKEQVYHYFSFTINSPYSPWEWNVFFEKFPGLEFIKIEYDPAVGSSNKWTYEGRIYAK